MPEPRPIEDRRLVVKLWGEGLRKFEIAKQTEIPISTVKRWVDYARNGPVKKVEEKPKPIDTTNMYQVTWMDGLEFKVEDGKPWRWADSGYEKEWMNTTKPVNQVLAKMQKDREDGIARYRNKPVFGREI